MKNVLALAMVAGSAISATNVSAQELLPAQFGGERFVEPVGYPSTGGYSSRAIQVAYDTLTNSFVNGATHLGACSQILDDVSFSPGPWSAHEPRVITEISWGVGCGSANYQPADCVIIFWDRDDVNMGGFSGTGTSMVNPAAVPFQVVRFALTGLQQNFIYQYTAGLTALPGGGVTIPAGEDGFVIGVAWVDTGFAPSSWADLWDETTSTGLKLGCASDSTYTLAFGTNTTALTGGNPSSAGFTNPDYGRDISNANMCPNLGWFVGGAAATAGDVERRTNISVGGRQVGYMLRLKGDAPLPPPPDPIQLGCVSDAGLTHSGAAVAGTVNWYEICINGAATDAALQFLDIDGEGSTGDIAMALYDSTTAAQAGGFFDANDDDSGSGVNPKLSFGVGRRAAVGDGGQYDGHNGQLNPGIYYLAVGPAGTSFGGGYNVVASTNPGGPFTLNFTTNTNGTPIAPSVAPTILSNDYGPVDPVAGSMHQGITEETGLRGVKWSKFDLVAAADSTHFLDIDFARASTASADGVVYLFNSSGDIMYFSDDEGPLALPQISLGAPGSRSYGTGGANAVPFDGNTPPGGSNGLAAGTYYLAFGLWATQDIGTQASHRFHVRGTSGSNLNYSMDLFAGSTGLACGTSDFNGDGDFGTDADIEAFFACLAGDCCATCYPGGADFNADGDSGTDADIESFFRVLAGGEC